MGGKGIGLLSARYPGGVLACCVLYMVARKVINNDNKPHCESSPMDGCPVFGCLTINGAAGLASFTPLLTLVKRPHRRDAMLEDIHTSGRCIVEEISQ